MSNSKKTPPPHSMRRPKATNEKRAFGKAKEEGVNVRGKRTPNHLPSDWDDKNIEADWKKQNKEKKPSRDTIRKGEEDEQSISKQMKQTGSATIKGPRVKERKHFAPATKVETPKKGKGSYNRQSFAEDEQGLGAVPLKGGRSVITHRKVKFGDEDSVPMKDGSKPKRRPLEGKRKKPYSFNENTDIAKFIDCILTKNYASADKYIKQAVESKIQSKIEQELTTPLFK